MTGKKPDVKQGAHQLIGAIFQRARMDVEAGNGHAAEAAEFLRHPGTLETLRGMGIDPDYYLALLDRDDHDADADLSRRIRSLHQWGLDRSGIAYALFGKANSCQTEQVKAVLGKAKIKR